MPISPETLILSLAWYHLFLNQDPYVVVISGGDKKQTQYCNEGGKQPHWNETLVFNNAAGPNFQVQVWDRDNITDDIVGEGLLQVNPNGGAGNCKDCII